ncbi:MAG TPA: oligosaccharide flippase family protein [Solirubrobacteraceae bacterium]
MAVTLGVVVVALELVDGTLGVLVAGGVTVVPDELPEPGDVPEPVLDPPFPWALEPEPWLANGSWYWLSAALWARAEAGAARAMRMRARSSRRIAAKGRQTGLQARYGAPIAAPPEETVVEPVPTGDTVVAVPGRIATLRDRLGGADTMRAAGLAGAMIATNAIALLLTIVFGRILGTKGYGSVSALLSTFLILSVLGQAIQLATARAGALGELGEGPVLLATVERWARGLILATVAVAVLGALARGPLATVIGVDESWGAAATLPAGTIWLLLCVQRGALQALGDYRAVGISMVLEQLGRLIFGAALALAGLDATGAFLGTPAAMVAMAIGLGVLLRGRLGHPTERPGHVRSLRAHLYAALGPIVGLALIALLQNVDVIVAKHRLSDTAAGAYASAAVAAKVVIWVAVGVAFYVVPEATRRAARVEDPLGVLVRGLGILAAAAIPALAIFAAFPHLLLKLAFGAKFGPGGDALLTLGLAFTLLACSYLAVQYLLALGRWRFLAPLAVVAVAEPFLLLVPEATRTGIAGFVLATQVVAFVVMAVSVAATHRRQVRAAAVA